MKKILFLFLTSVSCLGVGNIRSVNDLSELTSTNNNPRTILTNYMVINIGQLFYWDNNNAGATNASLLESLYIKDILGLSTGRFQRFAFTSVTNGDTYVTNLYVSNIITTNITVNNLTVTTNITIGGTNVPTINPTIGKYPYKDGTNSFGDGAITHIDATTAGVDEMDIGTLVVTNLMTGGFVISRTDGIMTNVPPNTIYLTGTTNIGIDSQVIFGPGTTNVLYRSGSYLTYTNGDVAAGLNLINGSGNSTAWEVDSSGNANITSGSSKAISFSPNLGSQKYRATSIGFWPFPKNMTLGNFATNTMWGNTYIEGSINAVGYFSSGSDYSRLAISHTGTNGAVVLDSQSAGTAGNPRNFNFNFNGTNLFSMPLSLTNPGFVVSNPTTGASATVESTSGGAAFLTGSGSSVVGLANSSHGVELFGTTFIPVADGDVSLGNSSTSSWWQDLALKGIANVSGYLSGTNYSRLELNHSGTNGVISFVSRANGNAGSPRPFQFTGADIILGNSHTPASSSETNYVGAITWDDNYIYVWTATNVNKRATLSTW